MFKKLFFMLTMVNATGTWASEAVQIVEPTTGVYRDSSEFHRIDKNFSLNYVVVGIGPSNSLVKGVNLGLFFDRNSLLEFEYVGGRPIQFELLSYSDYDISTNSSGLHLKHFFGNSFYFRAGADYRQVDYRKSYRGLFSNTVTSTNKFTADSITATVLIGNQWQWEKFTLGCDWIGLAIPVTTNIKSESVEGSIPDASYLKDDEDTLVKKNVTMGLRFYLGASF